MRRVFGIAVVAILIALPGFAQTIQIDYAHDFDFEGATTFQYAVNEESGIKYRKGERGTADEEGGGVMGEEAMSWATHRRWRGRVAEEEGGKRLRMWWGGVMILAWRISAITLAA